jgi:hypothetical protein
VLSSTTNGQLQSQHEYKQQQYDNTGKNKEEEKKNQFRLQHLNMSSWNYLELYKLQLRLKYI